MLPSCDVALLWIRHLLRTAVALPPLGSEQGTLLGSVTHRLLVRTIARWRITKAGTEKTIEVRKYWTSQPAMPRQTNKLLGLPRTVGDDLCAKNLYPGLWYGYCI